MQTPTDIHTRKERQHVKMKADQVVYLSPSQENKYGERERGLEQVLPCYLRRTHPCPHLVSDL
jgi:hypothetical protein